MDSMNKVGKLITRIRRFINCPVLVTVALLGAVAIAPAVFASAQVSTGGGTTSKDPARTIAVLSLHEAARTGNTALLGEMLQRGADANAKDSQGHTALMMAAKAGQLDAARLLLDAGADVNAFAHGGRTALIEATEQGGVGIAKLLVQHGADLNAICRTGTALEVAERMGNNEIATLLRQAGARSSGRSVGDTVCVRSWGGDGYCGVVEAIDKTQYQLRVTQIVGCKGGCVAKAECSAEKPVGGLDGISVGTEVNTESWCLTHTGVK